jgi:CheY-like chemotaxis protein/anti-sigma regulatory factor (Ser/Thr protein kinase)
MSTPSTVLVVDDTPLDRALASACLKGCGYQVVTANDGLPALDILKHQKIDFVLTDMQMPDLSGLELVRRMRVEHPKVPVILMTAHGSEETAVEALKAGAVSYVPKRSLKDRLPEALERVEQASRGLRQASSIRSVMTRSEQQFVLGYDRLAPMAVVNYLVEGLRFLEFSDHGGLMHITTALIEGITNAVDHGNLELNSALREGGTYRAEGDQRSQQPPYRDRRVTVTATIDPEAARFVIADQGPGFDPTTLPDPRDPENLIRCSGRGVMLIRTFMDTVQFNPTGNQLTMVKRRSTALPP